MDAHILTLYQHISSGPVSVEEIAECLRLSTKQARRKLARWQEDGYLSFQAGRGRGHRSTLRWEREVEREFEENFYQRLKEGLVEEVSKWLLYDWSVSAKQRLLTAFQETFGFRQEEYDRLVIPRFYPVMTFHPLEAADTYSAQMVATLFNRVVTLHADNRVTPELAHAWDYGEHDLLLYLRKDVAFHDGSVLTAADVVESLKRMKADPVYADLWEPITDILSPASLVVHLKFPRGCTYALQLLSLLPASIFKEVNGRIVGTGGFFLAEESETKTVLAAFKQYYGERPLLDRVEFLQVPKEFEVVYYGGHESNRVDTYKVESDSGFGVVVMNPFRDSDVARKEVRDYIHWIIASRRHELQTVNTRITGNHEGCLVGLSTRYDMTAPVKRPKLTRPLRLQFVNYTSDTTHWLRDQLVEAGLEVELEEISFRDSVYKAHVRDRADFFIHGEIFELNQNFSYYFFLKNCYSPLRHLVDSDPMLREKLCAYDVVSFEEWESLHLDVERYLINESLCVPLYYVKRRIPFSINLRNIEMKHFGYIDLAKVWMKQSL